MKIYVKQRMTNQKETQKTYRGLSLKCCHIRVYKQSKVPNPMYAQSEIGQDNIMCRNFTAQ